MAQLILKLKDREIKRINLSKMETTIGRDPECDMFIDNIGVSRHHSKIMYQGGRFVLRDNGSSNGTFLNGKQIDECEIHDGDEVQLGKYKVVFSTAGGMPEHLLQGDAAAAPADSEDAQKKSRNVFGTVQFSPDEIQNLISAKDEKGGGTAPRVDLPTQNQDPEEFGGAGGNTNQLNLILGGVVVLLLVVVIVLLVFR